MTSAPISARNMPHTGPATRWASSSTRYPASASVSAPLPVGLALGEEGPHSFLEVLTEIAREDQILGVAEGGRGGDPARGLLHGGQRERGQLAEMSGQFLDRKSTRLNSSHLGISYAVFCF